MINLLKTFFIYKIRLIILITSISLPILALIIAIALTSSYPVFKNSTDAKFFLFSNNQNQINVKEKAARFISQTFNLFDSEKNLAIFKNKERINILLLGRASKDYPGSHLTDTIILVSYKPKTNQAAMLSIPRDLYVKIPETHRYTKINFIYHYGTQAEKQNGGIKYMKKVVKEVTNQEIDYYIMLDFKGFEKLIDEIGGITVNVTKSLHDEKYPGPNFSYQTFHIDPGVQTLNGETALKYVRTRHNPGGDFGRSFRQQQVLKAVKSKILSQESVNLITKVRSLQEIIDEHMQSDINPADFPAFIQMARSINLNSITNKVLDNRGRQPLLTSISSRLGRGRAYLLKPVGGDYSRIHEIAENIFDLEKLRIINEKRETENPTILIVDKSADPKTGTEIKHKLEEFGFSKTTLKNDSSIEEETVIYDNTNNLKPYSLDILIKSLKIDQIKSNHPDKNYDLIIELGTQAENVFEENNILLPKEAYEEQDY
ncbi:MAG: hypothetical protein GF347_04570 [Candidatus Moranbacteria bacterium]|nr:hypothetical protein [Candidatus Moranbacteria bacterium]